VGRWNPAAGFWRQMGFNLTDRDQMYWRISWRLSAGDPAAQT